MNNVRHANFKGKGTTTRSGRFIWRTTEQGGSITYEYPTVRAAKASMEYCRVTGNMMPGYKQ